MNIMRTIIAIILLVGICSAQTYKRDEWRVLQEPQHKPNRVVHFLKKNIVWELAGVGISIGAVVYKQPHCNNYENGNTGVNVPCPVEHYPSKGSKR
jgi:hypothetical protein